MRRVLRRLRRIRYYSASRRETAWTRAMDVALVAALVLALPAAFLSTIMVQRPGAAVRVDGALGRLADGRFAAKLGNVNEGEVVAEGLPVGNFSLGLTRRRCGWPVTARVDTSRLEVMIDVYAEPAIRRDPVLDEADPLRRAIEAALAEDGHTDLLVAWRLGAPGPRHRVLGWIMLTATWWVLLWAVAGLSIQVLAYAWRIHRGRAVAGEAVRQASGRCARCGYDTRGIEFSERCPECGAILE